jgi:glycogen debranching enzyme
LATCGRATWRITKVPSGHGRSISEIFDAEEPYTPRGCCAQAWSVAEVLRLMTVLGADNVTSAEKAVAAAILDPG